MTAGVASPGVPDVVRVHPSELAGTVEVPGDKSLSHRALLIGSLADGTVAVAGLAPSGDVASSAAALLALGVDVRLRVAQDGSLEGEVGGPPRASVAAPVHLDCGNSGTSLRLLSGLVAPLPGTVVLSGDASLRRRPIDRIAAPLTAMGAIVEGDGGGRLPPVTVRGGTLHGITWDSPVASAQVKSAILLAATRADGTTCIRSPLPSRDHTERLLAALGGRVVREVDAEGREEVVLEPGPLVARPIVVPRDPSSAAFWHVAAACGDGTITTPGLCVNPSRTGALRLLAEFGADVVMSATVERGGEPVADVSVSPARLGAALASGPLVVDAIDELPVLALAGAMSRQGFEVRDASELRVKESDRITTLAATLAAVGVRIEARPDGFRVPGGQRPSGGTVDAEGDHRIAMTAAVAGAIGTGVVEVRGFRSVATSYPSFLADLSALGGRVEVVR